MCEMHIPAYSSKACEASADVKFLNFENFCKDIQRLEWSSRYI